jgi:type IV secretory pathway VirB10-like protein
MPVKHERPARFDDSDEGSPFVGLWKRTAPRVTRSSGLLLWVGLPLGGIACVAAGVVVTVLLLKGGSEGKQDKEATANVAATPAHEVETEAKPRREAEVKAEQKTSGEAARLKAEAAQKIEEAAKSKQEENRNAEVLNKAEARLADLKAKLLAAQKEEEQARQQATQARIDAEKAVQQARIDHQIYQQARAEGKAFQEMILEESASVASDKAAKNKMQKLRECEEKAQQAAVSVTELRADLRQAESDVLKAELAPR